MMDITREKIVITGFIALFEAIGLFCLGVLFFGIGPAQCDATFTVSLISILSAVIWGYLLCRNC
ncbi:MAG: hypothetical protein II169_05635 [Lachnospiraceae bacterium]|nr:hypothetical protein [Lachnospiraceae bacterium]